MDFEAVVNAHEQFLLKLDKDPNINNQGLNIRCVQANLYNLDGANYLDIEQIIPLPAAAYYQIKIRDKDKKAKVQIAKRQKTSLDILIEQGLITEGTCIHLIRSPRRDIDLRGCLKRYSL